MYSGSQLTCINNQIFFKEAVHKIFNDIVYKQEYFVSDSTITSQHSQLNTHNSTANLTFTHQTNKCVLEFQCET